MHFSTTRYRPLVLAAIFGAAATGCGGSSTGTLTGTITVKGKPVPAASVIVMTAGNEIYTGDCSNGKYSVPDVKGGTLKIAFVLTQVGGPPALTDEQRRQPGNFGREYSERMEKLAKQKAAESGIIVPDTYNSVETTPVTHDTSKGWTKDIDVP